MIQYITCCNVVGSTVRSWRPFDSLACPFNFNVSSFPSVPFVLSTFAFCHLLPYKSPGSFRLKVAFLHFFLFNLLRQEAGNHTGTYRKRQERMREEGIGRRREGWEKSKGEEGGKREMGEWPECRQPASHYPPPPIPLSPPPLPHYPHFPCTEKERKISQSISVTW